MILAAINGASVEKWVSSKWGIPHAPLTLARFARDLATVRANAHIWFPEIWSDVDAKRSDWKRRSSTIFFAMTSLEDEVLEAIREALPQFGVQCDALTGDGLLARPTYESASPLTNVLRAFEANVLSLARLEWPSSLAAKHSTASRPRLGQRRSARTQDPPVGTRSKSCGACSRGQGTGEERRRKVKARARTGAGNTRGLRTQAKTPPFPLPSIALDCINEKGQPAFPFQCVFSLFLFLFSSSAASCS